MSFITLAAYISIIIISISMMMTLARFILGPSLPDRVISLDVFAANLLSILAVYAILSQERTYLMVALSMSLIAFVGTMTFAYYLVHKKGEDDD